MAETSQKPANVFQNALDYVAKNHLWVLALLVVPVSLVYDVIYFIRLRITSDLFGVFGGDQRSGHLARVASVQKQVRQWNEEGRQKKMCTARPCWKSISLQKMTYKDRCFRVEIDMPNIISIDEENKRIWVEPNVSIGQINDYLIGKGWTLPVVPELDDLTIGGLVMGGGIESTSHKYGLFQYICKAFELVTSDGEVLTCSETQDPELFSAMPFCYGTLGFLTAVELDIIPYKPYMKVTYEPVYSLDAIVDEFTRITNDPSVDSVEGIMYSLDKAVIMRGQFSDDFEPRQLNRFGRWYKPHFYKHVEQFLEKGEPVVEYIPTRDFYHRQNRSFFWLMPYIIPFANHWLFRLLLGWAMPPKFSLLKFLRQQTVNDDNDLNFVCQDFGYKLEILKDCLKKVHEETEIYPLWLCPTRHLVPKSMEHLSLFRGEDVHVDVGIYGYSKIPGFNNKECQRRLERHAIDTGSYVALYAETQLTRQDFDDMFGFNLRNYSSVKRRLGSEDAFPHIYEKISHLGRK